MILARFFRQKSGDRPVEFAYAAIVAAARRPVLYEDFEVADTLDGRLDMVALHSFALMERLQAGGAATEDFGQELADHIFLEMDRAFREMGVGDLSVAKRVRKLAEVFYGRLSAYTRAAGQGEPAMAQALQRNVYPGGVSPQALAALTNYVMFLRQGFAQQDPAALARGSVNFPGDSAMRSPVVEFSRPLPVDRVPREGSIEEIEADSKERDALARRFEIPAIYSLLAELRADPWRGGGLKISGKLVADIDQICVVTLERFRQTVAAPVERVYLPQAAIGPGNDDDVDLLIGGVADLGELVAETLALWLDPYPRKPGASFAGAELGVDTPSSSFAPLAILSKTVKREPSRGGP